MKDPRDLAASAEAACQRLGNLAGLVAPPDAPPPGEWANIQRRLGSRWRGPSPRRFWPALAVAVVIVLCAAGYLVARRPLGYRVVDCTLAADGVLAATAKRAGVVAFDDGSRMAVEQDARFRLGMLPFGHGADIRLEEGEAHLAVAHRPGARWSVQAGPFRIDVTGTRFGVRWSRQLGRFQVAMLEGEVLVAGGAIPPGTCLRTGHTLSADLMAASFTIANAQSQPAEVPPVGSTGYGQVLPAEPAKQVSPASRVSRPPLPAKNPRRRTEAAAREESPAVSPALAATEPALVGSTPPTVTLPAHPPALSSPTVAPKPATLRVVFGEAGQLSNGFTGDTWVSGGDGTTFSTPASRDEHTRLRPEAGLLCASGTVAGLVCVNENLPTMHCNWERNWGVAIGWHTRADHKAWGDEAAVAIAVEFRGRSASYRLNAHRKGDPSEKMFCIENYKSGQVVRPSMFKSECWFDQGDTLADFQQIDLFNLHFPSGMSYVAFRYCLSGITLVP